MLFRSPEQPGDDFILGLAPGVEALPVQPLHLQRAEQRLAAGIVPTIHADSPVIVAVGTFFTNGGPNGTGKIIAAEFKEATGDAYEATLHAFDFDSGYFRADCKTRFGL